MGVRGGEKGGKGGRLFGFNSSGGRIDMILTHKKPRLGVVPDRGLNYPQ